MRKDSVAALTRPLEGVQVLVVDDSPDARDVFALLLTLSGATVEAVGSAAEAMAALERGHFHAVLSDVNMPDESGLELIRRVRMVLGVGALPAVAVTADPDPTLHAELLTAGFQMRLAKPVACSDLVAALREVVAV